MCHKARKICHDFSCTCSCWERVMGWIKLRFSFLFHEAFCYWVALCYQGRIGCNKVISKQCIPTAAVHSPRVKWKWRIWDVVIFIYISSQFVFLSFFSTCDISSWKIINRLQNVLQFRGNGDQEKADAWRMLRGSWLGEWLLILSMEICQFFVHNFLRVFFHILVPSGRWNVQKGSMKTSSRKREAKKIFSWKNVTGNKKRKNT